MSFLKWRLVGLLALMMLPELAGFYTAHTLKRACRKAAVGNRITMSTAC